MGCGYFFPAVPPPPGSAGSVFGWDFFNPFEGIGAVDVMGLDRSSEEELRVVREEEGIPELEDEYEYEGRRPHERKDISQRFNNVAARASEREEETGEAACASEREEETRAVEGAEAAESPGRGRDLLDALKDVEVHFIRAHDSGMEVSTMLEAHRVCLPSAMEEPDESPSKVVQAITWHRSTSSLSSSCKSYLASSSSSTSYAESNGDLFDSYSGMESGSHSETLGRLYAWEKKLYEEVKDGDETRQVYVRKCAKLRNQEVSGANSRAVDKTRSAVRGLCTRIFVALRSAETISARIQKMRDEELEPQLIELLQGLRRNCNILLDIHTNQKQIMLDVKPFKCCYGKFCTNSQRYATVKLEAELHYWRTCFVSYVAAQKAYVEALDGWLSKFFIPEIEYYSCSRSLHPSYRVGAPPLLVICHEWSNSLGKLPDKPVSFAMKNFIKDVRVLWAKQGEEQHQKRRVDSLSKEFDRKVLALQKAEAKIFEIKISEMKTEPDVLQKMDYLVGRKELLDAFRKKLETEKSKHLDCVEEMERTTFHGFKIRLTNIFESLRQFCCEHSKFYDELLNHHEKVKLVEMAEKPVTIEGSQTLVGNRDNLTAVIQ